MEFHAEEYALKANVGLDNKLEACLLNGDMSYNLINIACG
jgi:hypothetical protein